MARLFWPFTTMKHFHIGYKNCTKLVQNLPNAKQILKISLDSANSGNKIKRCWTVDSRQLTNHFQVISPFFEYLNYINCWEGDKKEKVKLLWLLLRHLLKNIWLLLSQHLVISWRHNAKVGNLAKSQLGGQCHKASTIVNYLTRVVMDTIFNEIDHGNHDSALLFQSKLQRRSCPKSRRKRTR